MHGGREEEKSCHSWSWRRDMVVGTDMQCNAISFRKFCDFWISVSRSVFSIPDVHIRGYTRCLCPIVPKSLHYKKKKN